MVVYLLIQLSDENKASKKTQKFYIFELFDFRFSLASFLVYVPLRLLLNFKLLFFLEFYLFDTSELEMFLKAEKYKVVLIAE